ncbi:hypothetical protein, variant [Sphaeroforma arctica JP610]|uniref:6-phosphofructo-2-kinase domain-containing protein n=1 Tax=Sphaeroforma arctica JP610 TaxID=667725 RepID=A0A0L0GGB9_9EUKA|nr:hypothetical protein, variant [Sphaeroforma arctica JP610]KNC87886.1 hypothetical protein, variant [Sphaeroforma arctica JP610]|eukprot:XP_014161789.1 hypothetical protein, variant [Sphaeroforma arctica JP610]
MGKESERKHAVIMVGLPARGKTYIASKVCRYLKWKGFPSKIFNTGRYRQDLDTELARKHDFFTSTVPDVANIRKKMIDQVLEDMVEWLKTEQARVGIYDATSITRERRKTVYELLSKEGFRVFFIESVCEDESIIQANIEQVKLTLPDYAHMDKQTAAEDFKKRLAAYEDVYEEIDLDHEGEYSFLRMIDVNRQIVCNKVNGYMQTGIVYLLMNVHIVPRTIYFSRHGESQFNVAGRIGGNSGLSPRGLQYAKALKTYMGEIKPENLEVWTSTMLRTIMTAEHFTECKREWRCLEEIDAGTCDGLTYEEIQEKFPDEFANRDEDKFNYRYPRGESYKDIITRLEPVLMELERAHNVLLVSHQAVLRCLLSYYLDIPPEELPYVKVPLHTLLKLTPTAYGCNVEQV